MIGPGTRITRGRFLATGAVAAAAATVPTVTARAQSDAVAWLNALLRAEFALVALLEGAIDRLDLGAEIQRLVEATSNDDQEHTRGLANLVTDAGGAPIRRPVIDVPRFAAQDEALRAIAELKGTVVAAYDAVLADLDRRLAAGTLAGIANVEAQHLAVLRMAAGEDPVEGAFAPSVSLVRLREAVDPYARARVSEGSG